MTEQSAAINSCVYQGRVRHRRFMPVSNEFSYDMFMLYLDLDELEGLFKQKWFAGFGPFNLARFKRDDYFNPQQPDLKQAIIDKVAGYCGEQSQVTPNISQVCLLTHVRNFNLIFNPVSFYYCFDNEQNLVAIVSEITNTPWGERHAYVLLVGSSTSDRQYQQKGDRHHSFDFDKQFHVSPFNPMNMQYHWMLSSPLDKLHIHMDNTQQASHGIDKHFDATLMLEKKPWQPYFAKSLIQYPLMTVKIVLGIYWQALKLWLKKSPFYDHPDSMTDTAANNK